MKQTLVGKWFLKKGIFAFVLLFFTLALAFSTSSCNKNQKSDQKEMDVTVVDNKPQYPGGNSAMINFISKKVKYPAAAKEAGAEGEVIVSFLIDEKGRVTNAEVKKSVHPALDKEALRVVKLMPKWEPGRQNGEPVVVSVEIPISFKLTL
ncbi:MAG: energy transducer TonB [Bacteroidales bacterium]|nr:energy transducer TonB [Bacteroidales bacterium]